MNTPVCILLVVDAPAERRLVREVLCREGADWVITEANSRAEVEAALAEGRHDLVLSSAESAGLSALELLDLAQLRQTGPPVVFLGEAGSVELAVRTVQRGAADYLGRSPAELQRLPTALRGALERQRLRARQEQAEAALEARARQHAALVELGRLALSGADLPALFDAAVAMVAQTLHVEFAKVLELLPEGAALRLRAGVGWKPGLVGEALVPAGLDSQAGYTLKSNGPIIVQDLRAETRFHGPALLHDHGIVSGLSVVIGGSARPFGVLGAHTSRRRLFTEDDVHSLQAVAHVLATAVERKAAEQALATERDLLQALMDNIPDTIYFKDTESRFTRVNQAQARTLGLATPEAAIGKTDLDFFNPEHARAAFADEQRLLASGQPVVAKVERLGLPDGGWRWVTATKVPLRDATGRVWGLVGISRDVTGAKEAEKALAESETQFRGLAEICPAAILIHSGGKTLYANAVLEDVLGYTRGETLGMSFWHSVHPDHRELVRQRGQARCRGEQPPGRYEVKMLTKAGAELWVEVRATPIEFDRQPAVLATCFDITERKQAEQERERLIAQLQEALGQAKTLKGLLPICAGCKKIRDDRGDWNQIEAYIQRHSDAVFSHGLCPDCIKKYFPDYVEEPPESPGGPDAAKPAAP